MKKRYRFIVIIVALIALFFPEHGVLAATCTEEMVVDPDQGVISIIFDIILRVFSRLWVLIAVLAGKLMSNDWVYASGIGFDETLRKLWNYIKNIANFTIGGFFIYQVVKGIVGKSGFDLKVMLPKILIASVLANMSWFIMGVLVDLSNVATSAIGAIPQAFFQENKEDEANMRSLLSSVPKQIDVDMSCKTPIQQKGPDDPKQESYELDNVRADMNDMSGPLLYMGLSIFRFQEYNRTNENTSSIKDITIGGAVKIIILFMFLLPTIGLFVVNLKRVFYLWAIIIFSPLIVLFNKSIGLTDTPKLNQKIGGQSLGTLVSLKEIIGMVFTPVFTIGAMSIALILAGSMYFVLGGTPGNDKIANTKISTVLVGGTEIQRNDEQTSTFYSPGTEITFQGDIFGATAGYAGGLVGYLIIVGFTIILLWGVLGASLGGSALAKSTYDGIMKFGKNLITGFEFLPLPGGAPGKKASIGSYLNMPEALAREQRNIMDKKVSNQRTQLTNSFFTNTGVGKTLQKGLGIDIAKVRDLEKFEVSDITKKVGVTNKFSDFISTVKTQLDTNPKQFNFTTSSTNFTKLFTDFATKNPSAISGITGYDHIKKNALAGFTPEKAKDLFDTDTEIGKTFTALVSSALTGKKVQQGGVNKNTIIYGKDTEE